MKPELTCTEWHALSEHLANATREIAEIANMLDRRVATEHVCDESKKIEIDLCVLESRLRHLRKRSECHRSTVVA